MRTLLIVAAVFGLQGCTAALYSMEQCKKTCNGAVQTFEMRGDENTMTCQCCAPKKGR